LCERKPRGELKSLSGTIGTHIQTYDPLTFLGDGKVMAIRKEIRVGRGKIGNGETASVSFRVEKTIFALKEGES